MDISETKREELSEQMKAFIAFELGAVRDALRDTEMGSDDNWYLQGYQTALENFGERFDRYTYPAPYHYILGFSKQDDGSFLTMHGNLC